MPRSESRLSPDTEQSFRGGLEVPVGKPGWPRAWILLGANRQVIGHSDLRSYPDRFVAHRCQLGMGVHREHRRRGLGALLIAHAEKLGSHAHRTRMDRSAGSFPQHLKLHTYFCTSPNRGDLVKSPNLDGSVKNPRSRRANSEE